MKNKNASGLLLTVTACLLAMPSPPANATEQVVSGRASVVDGDTLELHGLRMRLDAIDAPEARQRCHHGGNEWPCGRRAAFALADMIGTRPVTCRWRTRDRYRRAIARCEAGDTDLGGWMVEQGWALAYRRYGLRYVGQEQRARAQRRGIWVGWFVPPWTLRRGNDRTVSAESYAGT